MGLWLTIYKRMHQDKGLVASRKVHCATLGIYFYRKPMYCTYSSSTSQSRSRIPSQGVKALNVKRYWRHTMWLSFIVLNSLGKFDHLLKASEHWKKSYGPPNCWSSQLAKYFDAKCEDVETMQRDSCPYGADATTMNVPTGLLTW